MKITSKAISKVADGRTHSTSFFSLCSMRTKNRGPHQRETLGCSIPVSKKVYDIPFTPAQLGKSMPDNVSKSQLPATKGGEWTTFVRGHTWCVANEKAGEEKLRAALDYICGQGRADCRPIQQGAACYNPNMLEAHASHAFNSYYQKMSRGSGKCDFGGAAYVVTQPPPKYLMMFKDIKTANSPQGTKEDLECVGLSIDSIMCLLEELSLL